MKINKSTFTIVSNGFADGPAQALRDYLIKQNARKVVMITHPLVSEGSNKHIVTIYENKQSKDKKISLPHKPPYTYLLDSFVPLRLPKTNAWFGFNNLAAYRGLMQKKRGKTDKVFYWAVDFVPNRFGNNPITKIYERLDKKVSTSSDGRIELSEAAANGRLEYLGINKKDASLTCIAPMGAWLDRVPKATDKNWHNKKIMYLGHLVERQGVDLLLEAFKIVAAKDKEVRLEIIGSGPEKVRLENMAKELRLSDRIIFHGFVKDHKDVEEILASGSIAVAPYRQDKDSFTQFADPGKLKAYLGAGLPIVLTPVPPNAQELEKSGAAKLVSDSPQSIAEGIVSLLETQSGWQKAHRAALKYAKNFDWEKILAKTLSDLGFKV